jgi:FOG: WD40-like repeat
MANKQWNMPCSQWEEKLAALHTDDLLPSEKAELYMHLATCNACKETLYAYRQQHDLISQLSINNPPVDLPVKLLEIKAACTAHPEEAYQASIHAIHQHRKGDSMPVPTSKRLKRDAINATDGAHQQAGTHFFARHFWLIPIGLGAIVAVVACILLLPMFTFTLFSLRQTGGYNVTYTKDLTATQSTIYVNNGNAIYAVNSKNGAQQHIYHLNDLKLTPKGTPVIVNNVMYLKALPETQTANPTIIAMSLSDDKLLWQYTIHSNSGPAPIVQNGIVYVNGSRSDGQACLYALQASTGKLLWQYLAPGINEYFHQPVVQQPSVYVSSSAGMLYALNSQDGTLRWQYNFPEKSPDEASMTSTQDALFVGVNKKLYALQSANGRLLWQKQIESAIHLIVADGSNLYMDTSSTVYRLNTANGNTLWKQQMGNSGSGLYALFVLNDKVFVGFALSGSNGKTEGYIAALHTNDGSQLWQYDVGLQMLPSFDVANDAIYIAPYDTLIALKSDNGHVLWQAKLD